MLKVERRKAQRKKAGWQKRRREKPAPERGGGSGLRVWGTLACLEGFLCQAGWEVMGRLETTE